ncbi:MAG: AAA family ATPase [Stomatobaculum sp.]
MDKKLVITIEREYGSGGRVLGKTLSEQLGIPYYDDDIIKMSSEQSAVGEQFFRMHDEKPGKNPFLFGTAKNVTDKPQLGGNITRPENLFRFEAETIRGLAEKGSCILIGRCSDFVLSATEFGDFVSLFVYCDLSDKIRRVIKVDGVDTEEALRRIQSINKQRKSYCRYYTGNSWGDPALYDLMLNTSHISIRDTAELVKLYLKLRGYTL